MPYISVGETGPKRDYTRYEQEEYDYEYPHNLDLRPGSDFHRELADRIWERANESHTELSRRFDSWREIDEVLTVYIQQDDEEKDIKDADRRRPTSIVFPYTYAMLEALMTYMTMALMQEPMFQYEGVDDRDTVGAMLLEQVINMHVIKSKIPLALHTIIRDSFAYGVGIGVPGWTVERGKVPIRSEIRTLSDVGEDVQEVLSFRDDVVYEGNTLMNVDPYMYLPDPSVSSDKIQDGEFVGWIERDNYVNLLSDEQLDDNIFNVKASVKKNNSNFLNVGASNRKKSGYVDGWQAYSNGVYDIKRLHLQSDFFFLNNDNGFYHSKWIRYHIAAYYKSKFLFPGYEFLVDRNRITRSSSDSIIYSADNFEEHRFFIRSNDTLYIFCGIILAD